MQDGALRNGRFPVQTLVMVDKNARGGTRRNGRFPSPVGRVNMKSRILGRDPHHDRTVGLYLQL